MVVFPIVIDGRPAIAEMKGVEAESSKLVKALDATATSVDKLEKELGQQAKASKDAAKATTEEAAAEKKSETATKAATEAKQKKTAATNSQREAARRAAAQNAQYEKSMMGVRSATMGARGALLSMVAVGGMTLGLAGTLKLLGDYEEKTAILGAVSRATAADQALLGAQARLLGESTRYTASQGVDAQTALARAGLSVQETLKATPAVLSLATVASIELGDAATFVANSLRQFNIDAAFATRVTDGLTIVSNRANTDVRAMAEALAYAGPVANAAGRSFQETAAAIGVLGDSGITGSMAGTNLRGMLSDLLSRSDVTERALARMGLTFEQVNPLTNDLADIFETLNRRGFGAADAIEIFGDRNAAAALVIANNTSKLRDLIQAQQDFKGEAQESADVIEGSLRGAYLGLASAIEGLVIQEGQNGLSGMIRGVVQTGTDAVRVLGGLSQETKEVSTSGKVAAISIEALAGGLAAMTALKVVTGLSSIASSIVSMGAAAALGANPAGALTAVVIGLGIAAGGAHGVFDVWNDSLERNRKQLEENKRAAEGFRESFESIETVAKRLSQATSNAASGLMFAQEAPRIAERFAGLPGGALGAAMLPLGLQSAQIREEESQIEAMKSLLAKLGSSTDFDPRSGAGASVAATIRDIASRSLGKRRTEDIFAASKGAYSDPSLERQIAAAPSYGQHQLEMMGELERRAEGEGLRAVVEASIKKLETTLDADRHILAMLTETQRGLEKDHAASVAAVTATKDLQEHIALLEKRKSLMEAGDAAGLAQLDAESSFAEQLKAAGDAATPLIERIAALNAAIQGVNKDRKTGDKEAAADTREVNRYLDEQLAIYQNIERAIGELGTQRALMGRAAKDREIADLALRMRGEGADQKQIDTAVGMLEQLQGLRDLENVAFGIGDAIAGGMERAVFQGGKLKDVLRSIAQDIYQLLFRQLVTQPIAGELGSIFSSIFGVSNSGNGGVDPGFAGPRFDPVTGQGFANGGIPEVISRRSYFPMAGGRTGMAGESGVEVAIAPLVRTKTGRLGVESVGGGGGQSITNNFNMTFNGVPSESQARLAASRVRSNMQRVMADPRGRRRD